MRDDDAKPQPTPAEVLVCINRRFRGDQPSCAARGSEALADALEAALNERRINVDLQRSICMGRCTRGPTVRFAPGGRFNLQTSMADIPTLVDELETLCGRREDDDTPPAYLLGS